MRWVVWIRTLGLEFAVRGGREGVWRWAWDCGASGNGFEEGALRAPFCRAQYSGFVIFWRKVGYRHWDVLSGFEMGIEGWRGEEKATVDSGGCGRYLGTVRGGGTVVGRSGWVTADCGSTCCMSRVTYAEH